jgi:hypothetical protein
LRSLLLTASQNLRTFAHLVRTPNAFGKVKKNHHTCLFAPFPATSIQVKTGMATEQKENL